MANQPRKIEYGHLVEAALRTVVRDVLGRHARGEVPPPHYFLLTFRTDAPGVELADHLRQRYPVEMTIVLQHQYWELDVDDEGFAVTLSFNDIPERLIVPFTALKVFADPGVDFGLQFTLGADPDEAGRPVASLPRQPRPVPAPVEAKEDETGGEGDAGAEIVTLDRFRKK